MANILFVTQIFSKFIYAQCTEADALGIKLKYPTFSFRKKKDIFAIISYKNIRETRSRK